MAKLHGYRVIANDWEPYAQAINRCYVTCNRPPDSPPWAVMKKQSSV